ncbi:MAG: TIM barrel protein, partial [Kofleriaceae bacterium]
ARTRAWAATTFARARAVGIAVVVFGSGGARSRPDSLMEDAARTAFATLAAELADLAASAGLVLAIEPLQRAECNFINTLDDAADVIARAPRPNLGILADLFHMRREGEGPESITRNGRLIRHVHVAELATRSAPGVDGDDFRPWLAALTGVGYDRTMSLECGWRDFAREAPAGLATMRRQWAEAGAAAAG